MDLMCKCVDLGKQATRRSKDVRNCTHEHKHKHKHKHTHTQMFPVGVSVSACPSIRPSVSSCMFIHAASVSVSVSVSVTVFCVVLLSRSCSVVWMLIMLSMSMQNLVRYEDEGNKERRKEGRKRAQWNDGTKQNRTEQNEKHQKWIEEGKRYMVRWGWMYVLSQCLLSLLLMLFFPCLWCGVSRKKNMFFFCSCCVSLWTVLRWLPTSLLV